MFDKISVTLYFQHISLLQIINSLSFIFISSSFSNTFEDIRANANVIWKYQRYHLLEEYSERHWVAPPFSLLVNAYDIAKFLREKLEKSSRESKKSCVGKSKIQNSDFYSRN